jgi:hypothetical protein
MLACSACHVIAAVVLFNGTLAGWANFRVCLHPDRISIFTVGLFLPFRHDLALSRRMALAMPTGEAEAGSTLALHVSCTTAAESNDASATRIYAKLEHRRASHKGMHGPAGEKKSVFWVLQKVLSKRAMTKKAQSSARTRDEFPVLGSCAY